MRPEKTQGPVRKLLGPFVLPVRRTLPTPTMTRPTTRTTGRRWMRIRERQLRHFPLCAECRRLGRVTAATEVDHIVRLQDGGTDHPSNLQSLCHDCHALKTANENGATNVPRPRGCDVNGMPTDPGHPWATRW